MADETAPQTAQDTPTPADPQAAPVADQGTEPQVSPDPTSTGSTSSGSPDQPSGEEPAPLSPVDPTNPSSGVTPDVSNPSPAEDHSPPAVVGEAGNVAPSTTGSGSGAAPDQTSGQPLTGLGPQHETDAGLIAPAGSTAEGSDAISGVSPDPSKVGAAPVTVDNRTRRSGDDALLGTWVDVISGPNAGRFGSYVDTVHHDAETGYPTVILIRSRDARNELLEVAYEDVRPSERNGGR